MGWESSDVFRFDLELLLQGQIRTANFESAYNLLIFDPRDLQCETSLQEVMGWGSTEVVRFGLIIGLRGLQCEPNL